MNLEDKLKDCISNELEKGVIEKVLAKKLEECISKSIEDLFSWNGAVKKVVEKKVTSVMVPYLENYDYSKYVVKLDSVLTEIIDKTTADNRKILSNFKKLMSVDTSIGVIKVSDLFAKWCEYVEKNVDTTDLKVDYDDGPHYESVEVNYSFEETEKRGWLKHENGRIVFECEHDEKMNMCIDLHRWDDLHKKDQWTFEFEKDCNLSSLKHIDEFKLYLMALKQANVYIEIDIEDDCDSITPEKEPEVYFE